jgi:hypothetical protein
LENAKPKMPPFQYDLGAFWGKGQTVFRVALKRTTVQHTGQPRMINNDAMPRAIAAANAVVEDSAKSFPA